MLTADVLIIGSGGAGLRAAIELDDNNIDVLVIGKCTKRDAHTVLATGGINAALATVDAKDSWKIHAADTIRDGGMINNPKLVELLCKNAPHAVKELAAWGTPFNLLPNGDINQRFFGAATFRRACFVGDYTGKHILKTLVDQTIQRKIRFKSEVYIFSLLCHEGKVNGAVGLDIKTGKRIVIHAKVIVLATGGHSRMFSRSSSRFWENNGDGIALANQCGGTFMDMEMFQFHPTGMVHPVQAEGTLVTEAVRGEGGLLTNSHGERFMYRYDPKRLELSARDVVSRAIWSEISRGNGTKHNGVWLDISHKEKKMILERLPRMYAQFKHFLKLDISKNAMEVAPTAHYSMGGILTDNNGRTTVENLFAIGEVTSGVHGGNRLGGNSLAEICVFGRIVGKYISTIVRQIARIPIEPQSLKEATRILTIKKQKIGHNAVQAKIELQQMMWQHCGVIRDKKSLDAGLRKLNRFKKLHLTVRGSFKMNQQLIAALDFNNMIPTCEMILKSALLRTESRAAHYRSDYPKLKKTWRKNIYCANNTYYTKPTPAIPKNILRYINGRRSSILLE